MTGLLSQVALFLSGNNPRYYAIGQAGPSIWSLLEDRYGTRSTIVTSQVPPSHWHEALGDPTLADAICDRLLHNSHRLVLKGPSRRKEEKLEA